MPSTVFAAPAALFATGPANHPSLDLLVTEQQRERGLAYLQQAYAERRLTEYELDQRIGTVLAARTRREMNQAFQGLAVVPVGHGASLLARRPAGQPGALSRTGATLTHLSGLATWAVGPAVVYAAASPGSSLRREAAKAFNFQVLAMLVWAGASLLLGGWAQAGALLAVTVGWFLLTVLGAARAAEGADWRNPVTRALPLRLLDEGPRPRGGKALASGCAQR